MGADRSPLRTATRDRRAPRARISIGGAERRLKPVAPVKSLQIETCMGLHPRLAPHARPTERTPGYGHRAAGGQLPSFSGSFDGPADLERFWGDLALGIPRRFIILADTDPLLADGDREDTYHHVSLSNGTVVVLNLTVSSCPKSKDKGKTPSKAKASRYLVQLARSAAQSPAVELCGASAAP